MIPYTGMAYDFRTDPRTDSFLTATGVGISSANVTLLEDLFDCDTDSVEIDSDVSTDNPLPSTYNCTSRVLLIIGLTTNTSRTLDVTYDVDALGASGAISTLIDRMAWIWLLCAIAFAPAALFSIFTSRD